MSWTEAVRKEMVKMFDDLIENEIKGKQNVANKMGPQPLDYDEAQAQTLEELKQLSAFELLAKMSGSNYQWLIR